MKDTFRRFGLVPVDDNHLVVAGLGRERGNTLTFESSGGKEILRMYGMTSRAIDD